MQVLFPTKDNQISQWSMAFLILLPFLILGSRGSSDVTASITALFLAGFWFMHPTHVIRRQAWFNAFLVLWLFMCVTSLFSSDPKYVLIQSIIAIRWPAFALVLVCLVFTDNNRLRIFERSALVLFIFIVLDSILQYCIGRDVFGRVSTLPSRLTGPFSQYLPGSYGLRIYPMALVALLSFAPKLSKSKFLMLIVSMVVLSELFAFLTGERVVFVLFGLVNAALLVALVYQEKLSYRFVLASLSGFVVLAVGSVALVPKMYERTILSMIDKLTHFQDSDYYSVYHMAYILWQKSPWIGVGTRYYYQSCMALPDAMQPKPWGCLVHAHHIYIEWITQNGVFGLMLFLVVLFFIFKVLWRNLDFRNNLLQSTVVFVSLVMLFFPFTPSMSMQTNNYAGLVWLLVAWALARAMVQKQEQHVSAFVSETKPTK